MVKQAIKRGAAGLYSFPNNLGLPPGALMKARNCSIYRDGIISKRRGFERYGPMLDVGAKELTEFEKRVLVLDGNVLRYDSDGLGGGWTSWPGTYNPIAGSRIHFQESNQNLYWTTEDGVFKNDALAGVPVRAGMPAGLDIRLSLSGTGEEWFLPGSQVGYRVVWRRKDAKENLLLGTPSFREVATNPNFAIDLSFSAGTVTVSQGGHGYSTGDRVLVSSLSDIAFGEGTHTITAIDTDHYSYTDGIASPPPTGTGKAGKALHVDLNFSVPTKAGVKNGDYYQIYRTSLLTITGTVGEDPGDRHSLVTEKQYTSGTTVSYTDTTDTLGEELYTNDTQEGPTQPNDRPPACRFMALFKGHMFYADFFYEHFIEIKVESLLSMTNDVDYIQVATPTPLQYFYSAFEDVPTRKFRLFTTADAESPTNAQAVELTMKSFCRVVNQDPDSRLYAFYSSGILEDPGKVILRQVDLNTSAFTVIASMGTKYSPDLTTAQASANKSRKNGFMRSKFEEPEAVPISNEQQAGRANRAIKGMVSLAQALFIFTEVGIFKLTGESDRGGGFTFFLQEIDLRLQALAQNTLIELDNAAWSFSEQGLIRVVESGSAIVSRSIELEISKLANGQAFPEKAFSIAHEPNHEFVFFVPTGSSIDGAYVYNFLTKAWSTWDKPVNCGFSFSVNNRLYLGHSLDKYVLRQRRDFVADDFVDEDIPVTVVSKSSVVDQWGRTVTKIRVSYSYWRGLDSGWVYREPDRTRGIIEVVTDLGTGQYDLTLDRLLTSGSVTDATLGMGINMEVEWAPEAADNPGIMKQFPEVILSVESNTSLHHRFGFQSNDQTDWEYVTQIVFPTEAGWELFPWALVGWEQLALAHRANSARTPVPLDQQRCESLRVSYQNKTAREDVNILQLALDVRAYGSRTSKATAPV